MKGKVFTAVLANLPTVPIPSQMNPVYTLPPYYFDTRFNPLKTKRRLLYLKTQFVPRSKHFSSRL